MNSFVILRVAADTAADPPSAHSLALEPDSTHCCANRGSKSRKRTFALDFSPHSPWPRNGLSTASPHPQHRAYLPSSPEPPPLTRFLSPLASTSNSKRVKFASELNFARGESSAQPTDGADDEFESELDPNSSKKSKDIVTDGYDSDSSAGSDAGFGVGGGRKGNSAAVAEEEAKADAEDDDMFGATETDAIDGAKAEGKGKGKEFLDLGDIEGQEFGRGDDELVEEDEEEEYLEEDDLANDDDAPRTSRSKKTMGYKLRSVCRIVRLGFDADTMLQFVQYGRRAFGRTIRRRRVLRRQRQRSTRHARCLAGWSIESVDQSSSRFEKANGGRAESSRSSRVEGRGSDGARAG